MKAIVLLMAIGIFTGAGAYAEEGANDSKRLEEKNVEAAAADKVADAEEYPGDLDLGKILPEE